MARLAVLLCVASVMGFAVIEAGAGQVSGDDGRAAAFETLRGLGEASPRANSSAWRTGGQLAQSKHCECKLEPALSACLPPERCAASGGICGGSC